jgi:hypothetical protein
MYSHKGGEEFISKNRPEELSEIIMAIESLDGEECLTKISSEKTKPPLIFSPVDFNNRMKMFLCPLGWTEATPKSSKGFKEPRIYFGTREFREMDGIKNKVGLEIQFGKYAFMGYDIFSKMPIFAKHGLIDCGIEVVVMPSMIRHMSTGVSSFAQICMDMDQRGEADLDLPTLIIGFECSKEEWTRVNEKRERFKTHSDEMIANGEVSTGRKGAKPGPK